MVGAGLDSRNEQACNRDDKESQGGGVMRRGGELGVDDKRWLRLMV